AAIALGKIERGLLTPTERSRLYERAAKALDAADLATPTDDAEGRRKLAAAERRYRRVRESAGDVGLLP
ncbi:MAG: hypothetical protein OXG74_19130, partial [Acidobacteria bacterium]|nr:hypothetical protein [Acidobacteriota bacterium]